MGTTKEDIRGWLERGKAKDATHLMVVCDTFDYDDYPVFFTGDASSAREFADKQTNASEMKRLMEVYRLDMDWDTQLSAGRSFNY